MLFFLCVICLFFYFQININPCFTTQIIFLPHSVFFKSYAFIVFVK